MQDDDGNALIGRMVLYGIALLIVVALLFWLAPMPASPADQPTACLAYPTSASSGYVPGQSSSVIIWGQSMSKQVIAAVRYVDFRQRYGVHPVKPLVHVDRGSFQLRVAGLPPASLASISLICAGGVGVDNE